MEDLPGEMDGDPLEEEKLKTLLEFRGAAAAPMQGPVGHSLPPRSVSDPGRFPGTVFVSQVHRALGWAGFLLS